MLQNSILGPAEAPACKLMFITLISKWVINHKRGGNGLWYVLMETKKAFNLFFKWNSVYFLLMLYSRYRKSLEFNLLFILVKSICFTRDIKNTNSSILWIIFFVRVIFLIRNEKWIINFFPYLNKKQFFCFKESFIIIKRKN